MGTLILAKLGVTNSVIVLCNRVYVLPLRRIWLQLAPEMNLSKEAKCMNKLIGNLRKKRKYYFDEMPVVSSHGDLKLNRHIKNNKENSRRIAVLNSLFMKYISEILVTGSNAYDVIGKGLEISRVAMAPNFSQLNVFWTTNNDKNLVDLEITLPELGFTLRHELTQLGVMGVVPRIVFVKDKHFSTAIKVDYLLKIADYGKDHAPLQPDCEFKDTSVQKCVLKSVEVSNKYFKEDQIDEEKTCSTEDQMPIMRQDIFSLDHEKITIKIMKLMLKSRALHRFQPNLAIEAEGIKIIETHTDIDKTTKQERKEALEKFILDRKILQKRLKQNKYNNELNLPYLELQEINDQVEYSDFQNEDYIDEDELEDVKH